MKNTLKTFICVMLVLALLAGCGAKSPGGIGGGSSSGTQSDPAPNGDGQDIPGGDSRPGDTQNSDSGGSSPASGTAPGILSWTYERGKSYSDQIAESADGSYDGGLFSVNTADRVIADPAVIAVNDENSEYNGQYLLFGTTSAGGFTSYKSTDLVNWTFCSQAFTVNPQSWGTTYIWAPEVIYDKDKRLYYLFYSAQNRNLVNKTAQGWAVMLNVAVSEKPEGPYVEYNEYAARKDAESRGKTLSQKDLIAALSSPCIDQRKFLDVLSDDLKSDVFTSIDPSPFVDPVSGKKYLYFTRDRANYTSESGDSRHTWIYAVEMEDWATPKYETLTRLTTGDNGGYETPDNTINEGAQMTYNPRNKKYYLQYSVNSYETAAYCVGQAVGDSPLGPFRQLKREEGGLFIYSGDSSSVSGAGHHFVLTVGETMYVLYHRHKDVMSGGAIRVVAVDEAVWVRNADGLEVLHLNGPTSTLRFHPGSEYRNIAGEAKVTATGGENAGALTDGAIPAHDYETWINEYEMSGEEAVITIAFDRCRTVAGLMIYNSVNYDTAFENISEIVLEGVRDGRRFRAVINDLAFNPAYLENSGVVSVSAAIADFADIQVDTITITLKKKYADQDKLAIGEIYVIGK